MLAWWCAACAALAFLAWTAQPVQAQAVGPRKNPSHQVALPSEQVAVTYDVAHQVVASLASLMRSGAQPTEAWSALAQALAGEDSTNLVHPSGAEEQRLWARAARVAAAHTRLGGDLSRVAPAPELWPYVQWAARLSQQTGVAQAVLLDQVAEHASAMARKVRGKVTGMAAAGSSRKILGWLPLGGIALAQLLGAEPLLILFGTTAGRLCLTVGLIFWAVALAWSRRIVQRVGKQSGETST